MSLYEHEGSKSEAFLAQFWDQLKSVILSYEAPMFVCVLLNLKRLIHVVSLVGSIIRYFVSRKLGKIPSITDKEGNSSASDYHFRHMLIRGNSPKNPSTSVKESNLICVIVDSREQGY